MKVLYDTEKQRVPIKMWTDGVPVEDEAIRQLQQVAQLPFIYKHIAGMPDLHAGKGCCVGSVIPTVGAIVPANVGVDLGCGIVAVKTSLKASDLPENLKKMRSQIERVVPHGRTDNGGNRDKGAWGNPPPRVTNLWKEQLALRFEVICEKHPHIERSNNIRHLGSLGTGNHFIEVCLDKEDSVWFMLHSGSRGVGGRIGMYFIKKAKEDMERYFIHLPDKNLAYLVEQSDFFDDYVEAVDWAQDFARINRQIMMEHVIRAVQQTLSGKPFKTDLMAVNCHHNYISRENHFGQNVWVTRKGAVRARKDELGVVPGSMGSRSYIVRGLGNEDSFHSCSHGAGRAMSRTKAKELFTLDDHIAATRGVECLKTESVIDETPGAYKKIEDVMAAQSDLVEVVAELKQIVCIKG